MNYLNNKYIMCRYEGYKCLLLDWETEEQVFILSGHSGNLRSCCFN